MQIVSHFNLIMEMQGVAVKMLAAGAEHTTAVTENGKLYGWGWGRYGNLGLGDREDRLVPAEVSAIVVCPISSTSSFFFPLHVLDGDVYGQFPDGVSLNRLVPSLFCTNRGSE